MVLVGSGKCDECGEEYFHRGVHKRFCTGKKAYDFSIPKIEIPKFEYKPLEVDDNWKKAERVLSPFSQQVNVSSELNLHKLGYLDYKNLSSPVKETVDKYSLRPLSSSLSPGFGPTNLARRIQGGPL